MNFSTRVSTLAQILILMPSEKTGKVAILFESFDIYICEFAYINEDVLALEKYKEKNKL
jgi:hypothetical protein